MTLLDSPPPTGSNLPEYSVGDLARAVKGTIETAYGHVRVKGEISQPKLHTSGHLYLTLKDETATLAAVCWKGQVARLGIKAEEGLEVVVTGRLTTYPGRSQYQLIIESMSASGIGALLKMLEERKQRLGKEGLFDPARKKPLPFLPRRIGIITSPTGAVIRDILHRLRERFPCSVLLWPVAVQGEAAAGQVAAAIAGFNALPEDHPLRPDLLIVARGGGSIEDLWAFNEEVVVRAAANSLIPLISAVGHETDTTLIDYASDRRAPTPTAAAEIAVPVRADLLFTLTNNERRLGQTVQRFLDEKRLALTGFARGLADPQQMIHAAAQRCDEWSERLSGAQANLLAAAGQRLARLAAGLTPLALRQQVAFGMRQTTALGDRLKGATGRVVQRQAEFLAGLRQLLQSYSYQGVLERGFALVRDAASGQPLTRAAQLAAGQAVELEFSDGRKAARVESGGKTRTPQGELF